MDGTSGRRLAAIAGLLTLAAATYLCSRLLAGKVLSWVSNATQVASFFLALAAVLLPIVLTLVRWLRGGLPLSPLSLDEARNQLAETFSREWRAEDEFRGTQDPWALPVEWRQVHPARRHATQQYDGIRASFTDAQRLVILGRAGAGKSVLAIKLMRDLLDSPEPGSPLPIMLSAATWTDDQSLTSWITGQLARNWPGLNARIRSPEGTVFLPEALATGKIIPVIDGLDELPAERRSAVVSRINEYGSDHALVLTSRPDEYYEAIRDKPISKANVIELRSLKIATVKSYLTKSTQKPQDRWKKVFKHLDEMPTGLLALTLTNPLMLYLTRTLYDAEGSDPTQLITLSGSTGSEGLAAHLLAGFVPAAYSQHSGKHKFNCKAVDAEKWLTFLANDLERRSAQDIAWWRLSSAKHFPSPLAQAFRGALLTFSFWQITTWVLGRYGYMRDGKFTGRNHSYVEMMLNGPLGRFMTPMLDEFALGKGDSHFSVGVLRFISNQILHFSAAAGTLSTYCAMAFVGFVINHLGEAAAICLGAGIAFVFGILFNLGKSGDPIPLYLPKKITITRSAFWAFFLPAAWLPSVFYLFVIWRGYDWGGPTPFRSFFTSPVGRAMFFWVGFSVLAALAWSLIKPVELDMALDPVTTLRGDRMAYFVRRLGGIPVVGIVWLWSGDVVGVAVGLMFAATMGVQLLFGSSGAGAWPRYLDARLRFAVGGRLPWRVLAFLSDAHQRGVLRRTGATYQFRHIRLQKQLAAEYSPWPWSASMAASTLTAPDEFA